MKAKFSFTLKQQLRILFTLSWLVVILLIFFGGWRLQEFNKKNKELQQSAEQLTRGLDINFSNLKLLTEVQTYLRTYLRSAPPGVLDTLHQLSATLYSQLPPDQQPQLTAFLRTLDTLEIRMNSFRMNNRALNEIEREIVQSTDALLESVDPEFHTDIRRLTSQACLKHHSMFVDVIMTEDQGELQRLTREYEQLFVQIEEKIQRISGILPAESSAKIQRVQGAYYKLDESILTITAIRLITLDAKRNIKDKFLSLRTVVTKSSLSQANVLTDLIQSGMLFLKNNLLVMSAIMIIIALSGGVTALVLNHVMVKPLISFTKMLEKMTRMLAGMRRQNEFAEDFTTMLDSMTDRRDNEIGRVTTAVKHLLLRLRELAVFRQDIEDDETIEEIYQRLGRIFTDRLRLDSFTIFDLAANGTTMKVAHRQIRLDDIDQLETVLSAKCRGRCNHRVITSFKDQKTCAFFPLADQLRHVCVPMEISGQVIGVIQFLFPIDITESDYQQTTDALFEAMHYITEALPVIHAKRLTGRLQAMAMEDQLTGLANRHYLENSLDYLVAGAKRRETNICTMMCDLDHFKSINDTYGHSVGDKILHRLAKIFLDNVRETDLVVRFGGEEFLILLVDPDPGFSLAMAERIRIAVEKYEFEIRGATIQITISIGTAPFDGSTDSDIHESFKHADIAMYEAKENGRNQVIIYAETDHYKKMSEEA